MSGLRESCLLSSVRSSALCTGLSLLKLNKWKLPQSRFFWLDVENLEIRWSKNARLAAVACKKIPFKDIEKVGKVSKYRQMKAEHGFTVDVPHKTYLFRTDTLEIRDKIVQFLTEFTHQSDNFELKSTKDTEECEDTENCATPEPVNESELVLNEWNKSETMLCSREIFSKTGSAHRQAKYKAGNYRNIVMKISETIASLPNIEVPDSPSLLPQVISRVLQTQNEEIGKLQEELQRETLESGKIQLLRKRIKMLETAREKCQILEAENADLKSKISSQKEQNSHLERELSSKLTLKSIRADTEIPTSEEIFSTEIDLLKRGFNGYMLCIGDEVVMKQLGFQPDDSGSECGYVPRHILCSQDLGQMIWKPVSLFSNKRAFICVSEINTVISGTEDAMTLQPYPECDYLTLQCAQMTLIVAVETQYSLYLDAITAVFAHLNDLPYTPVCPVDSIVTRCRQMCQQYENQARLMEHLIRTYKKALTDSICDIHNGFSAQQAVYSAEIAQLRELNEKAVTGLGSQEALEYIRGERVQLLDRLRYLNEVVASLQNAARSGSL